MFKKVSLSAATLILAIASGSFAQSVLIGNAPGGGDTPSGSQIDFNTTSEIAAFTFRTPTGSDYEMDSISLYFNSVNASSSPVVRIHDSSDATLATLNNPGSLVVGENVFSLATALELSQDTVYKFSVYNNTTNSFMWASYTGTPAPSSDLGFTAEGGFNGYTYSTSGAPTVPTDSSLLQSQYMGAFSVNGAAIPEPATMTLLALGTTAVLLRKRRK